MGRNYGTTPLEMGKAVTQQLRRNERDPAGIPESSVLALRRRGSYSDEPVENPLTLASVSATRIYAGDLKRQFWPSRHRVGIGFALCGLRPEFFNRLGRL